MKIACLLITHLPIKAEMKRNNSIAGMPVLITVQSRYGAKVLDISPQISDVALGMSIEQAISRCKDAILIEADEMYYDSVFDDIVKKLRYKSPFVEKKERGCAFVDMDKTEGIYGDDKDIANVLLKVPHRDLEPRVGLSNSKFASYVAAFISKACRATIISEDVPGFLQDLSIDMLPLSWDDQARLHNFGLHSMGQIASLSVESMQDQFGVQGRIVWELANGIDKSALTPSIYQEEVTVSIAFPAPAVSLSTILSAAEILISRLLSHSSLRGRYFRSVLIQSNILNRPPWSKKIVFGVPSNSKETIILVLKNSLETVVMPGPLEDLEMTISETVGELAMQPSLFGEVRKRHQLHEVIRHLEVRLRTAPLIYKVIEVEPWSRIPERRQALVEFVP